VAGLKFRVWQSLCLCFLASTTNPFLPNPKIRAPLPCLLYTQWSTNSSVSRLPLRSSQTQTARNATTRRILLCYQGQMSEEKAKESYLESEWFFANRPPLSSATVQRPTNQRAKRKCLGFYILLTGPTLTLLARIVTSMIHENCLSTKSPVSPRSTQPSTTSTN
jgi:hypothetical protein